tara:strand:+ start:496 stop:672 length:177 start_codon:yes stop_codon:yes gene_type:complete
MSYLILLFSVLLQNVEMADVLRSEGKIYVVVVIFLLILFALFLYLYRIEKKVDRLKNK